MRCEDYPCCGHEAGDCPDAQGRFTCVTCGVRMGKGVTESICGRCRNSRRFNVIVDGDGSEEYDPMDQY